MIKTRFSPGLGLSLAWFAGVWILLAFLTFHSDSGAGAVKLWGRRADFERNLQQIFNQIFFCVINFVSKFPFYKPRSPTFLNGFTSFRNLKWLRLLWCHEQNVLFKNWWKSVRRSDLCQFVLVTMVTPWEQRTKSFEQACSSERFSFTEIIPPHKFGMWRCWSLPQ